MSYVNATEEITLPSGIKAVVKEITGNAEKTIANVQFLKQGTMVTKLIVMLLESLDGEEPNEHAVTNLYTADRRAILLKARELTYGEDLVINHKCINQNCGEEFAIQLNIPEDIEWVEKPKELKQEILLPASKLKAVIAPITGAAEVKMARSKDADRLIDALLVYIQEIEGNHSWKSFLENASARDTRALRKAAENIEFGPETNIEVRCIFCETSQNVELTNEPEFFFPRD